jgi:hypothetical protein
MSNQTPFVVEQELSLLLTKLAAEFSAEVIVGMPTHGLDYARIVAHNLGFSEYVALGNSRKFCCPSSGIRPPDGFWWTSAASPGCTVIVRPPRSVRPPGR